MITPNHAPPPTEEVTELELSTLLARPRQAETAAAAPDSGGIALGRLAHIDEQGQIYISCPALNLHQVAAGSLQAFTTEQIGIEVAFSFNPSLPQPLVLGALYQPHGAKAEANATDTADEAETDEAEADETEAHEDEGEIFVDGQRLILHAQQEIELRCGESALILSADGRIELRGTYITSQASATQRILGGSINLN